MAQTITKSELEARVAELEAQLAEAQQNAWLDHADGEQAQLSITVLLPESLDSMVYGSKAVKTREYEGITYVDCKCVFMAGSSYGRHYQVTFSDHEAHAVLDRIAVGKRLTNITANFRTRVWRKNEFENVTIDSWTALTVADVPGVNYPELANEDIPEEFQELPAPDPLNVVPDCTASDEDIPF